MHENHVLSNKMKILKKTNANKLKRSGEITKMSPKRAENKSNNGNLGNEKN